MNYHANKISVLISLFQFFSQSLVDIGQVFRFHQSITLQIKCETKWYCKKKEESSSIAAIWLFFDLSEKETIYFFQDGRNENENGTNVNFTLFSCWNLFVTQKHQFEFEFFASIVDVNEFQSHHQRFTGFFSKTYFWINS